MRLCIPFPPPLTRTKLSSLRCNIQTRTVSVPARVLSPLKKLLPANPLKPTMTWLNLTNSKNSNSNGSNQSNSNPDDSQSPAQPVTPPGPPAPQPQSKPPSNPASAGLRRSLEISQDSSSSSSSSSSGPPPKRHARRENRVLPSYEAAMAPDNTVQREPTSREWWQRWLHGMETLLLGTSREGGEGRATAAVRKVMWTPFDVKKVAVVGVHGWFPGKILKTVVGEPVGTSPRFADKMEQAVREFFLKRYGIMLPPEAVTKMPLEGEGKVEDRVELLYSQLVTPKSDWLQKLKEADLVLVAAHSQGTPVSVLLLSRLIKERIIDPQRQRVSLLAMAGISHGPFPHLKSSVIIQYVETDPARQLFEFNDWSSPISSKFRSCMADIFDAGVRVTAIGSWYDQVVPLYSATKHAFNHELLYRAIYIEGVDYTPDFLSHLVVFALQLRNAGISDRGIIVHLSEFLAGNVYGFGTQGHATLYEEVNTYMLSVAWAMGTPKPRPVFDNENPLSLFPALRNPMDPRSFPITSHLKQEPQTITKTQPKPNLPPMPATASLNPGSSAWITPVYDYVFGRRRVMDPPPLAEFFDPARPKLNRAQPGVSPVIPGPPPPVASKIESSNGQHRRGKKEHGFYAPSHRLNPYWLPWIMAQLVADEQILQDPSLRASLKDLLKMFEGWDPTSRPLRDLMYRLEPLKSRL